VFEHKTIKQMCCITRENKLKQHQEYCNNHEAVKFDLPKPGSMLGFKNYNRSMRHPHVVYADFESFIKPINTCQPDPCKSYAKKYQHNTPSSFCYYIKCFDEEVCSPKLVMYTAQSEDDDVAQKFVDMLEEDIKRIYKEHIKFPKEMKYTKLMRYVSKQQLNVIFVEMN